MPRLSADQWETIRAEREAGASFPELAARTDTRWWQDYCTKGEVHFVRGRLKFGGSANSAPFPSAVVVFRPRLEDVAWT